MWVNLLSWLFRLIPNENWYYRLPPALFNLSLTASIVILAVLVARFFLRKAPRVYSYALWAVVAFRLICPVSFSSGFSLLGILDAPVAEGGQVEYVPVTIVHDAQPSVDLIIPEITHAVNEQLPSTWEQAADPLEWPAALAAEIWIAGVGIMLLWALISFFNLRHKLRTAVLLEGNIFQSEHVGSPFILGLFRPKIYIPFGLDETTLKYVLAHERYHLKRLDHVVKVFAFALLLIHWFNPLCWLAFHLMTKDMEMSCDEKVLSQDNNVKTEYSTVLLSFAANRRFPSPSPLAFGETGAKSRIKNALKWKRPKVWVTILAAVLCIAIVAACAANPKEETSDQDESPYEWTSTVNTEDVGAVSIQLSNAAGQFPVDFSSNDVCELVSILNQIPSGSIYTGRGIPWQLSLKIVLDKQTVFLNYGGDLVEISYPELSTENGIWEIHDDALNKFMERCLEMAQNAYEEHTQENEKEEETERNQTQTFHDLTEQGPITLTAGQFSAYRFRTNSTKILLDFERSDEPIVIQLHAVDSESPILYFSTETSNIASCSFSNLTSAREYYLSADCADDVKFTISDGSGAFRVFPLT